MLATFLIIGAMFAFWFYTASNFATGGKLDLSKSSLLPIYCAIAPDRAADLKVTGEAYVWQKNVRIYVYRKNSALITEDRRSSTASEIVTPIDTGYSWYDGADTGTVEYMVKDFPIFDGISKTNGWFCWPWFLLDYSKFEIPKDVKFQ